jgi:hypothetical protein
MTKNKLPRPISILILTLLTTIVWVSSNIYRAVTVEPPTSVPQDILKSLNPTLNKDAIAKIEGSIFLNDSEIPQVSSRPSATTIPVITPSPIATPSASSSATATPSATPI